jgi:hypothetical protein
MTADLQHHASPMASVFNASPGTEGGGRHRPAEGGPDGSGDRWRSRLPSASWSPRNRFSSLRVCRMSEAGVTVTSQYQLQPGAVRPATRPYAVASSR